MEAARVIVDTDVLIDLLRSVKSIVDAIRDLESRLSLGYDCCKCL